MQIIITQKVNKKYYLEYYSLFLEHKSKFKKWEHKIGYVSLFCALLIYVINSKFYFISTGLLIFGGLMIFAFYSSKYQWIKQQTKSKKTDFTIVFKENIIELIGKETKTFLEWSYFSDAIKTSKGLILIPKEGSNLYLQKDTFDNTTDMQKIINKIKTTKL